MCNYAGNLSQHRFTVDDAFTLAKELAWSTIRHVRLTGGEPLLLEEVGRIVKIFKDAGIVVSIITNGLLLDRRWPDLAAAGLDQVVVSLDSPWPEVHDRFRKTHGLFRNAWSGIKRIRTESPSTVIRVNTVVGEHNLESLPQMFVFLHELGVKQWSLIPCKPVPQKFSDTFEDMVISVRNQLHEQVGQWDEPCLMGYSLDIFGRKRESNQGRGKQAYTDTPQPHCETVEWIRFLDSKTRQVFPCNCIPHRGRESEKFSEEWNPTIWGGAALEFPRKWLKQNGPIHCTCCEPLNVALGEGILNLNEDLFGF